MQSDIGERVTALKSWDRQRLVAEWRRLFELDVPKSLSKSLMIRAISYRWQEQIYGGLSPADQALLDRLVAAYESSPSTFQPKLQIKTGTRLRRIYKGKVHEVTVSGDSFLYEKMKYGSLSEIARLITGTRWNGRVFFGLKPPRNLKSAREGKHGHVPA